MIIHVCIHLSDQYYWLWLELRHSFGRMLVDLRVMSIISGNNLCMSSFKRLIGFDQTCGRILIQFFKIVSDVHSSSENLFMSSFKRLVSVTWGRIAGEVW